MSSPPDRQPLQRISAGGETLAVRRLGTGRRIVLLHGGPGLDHSLLLPLAKQLGRSYEVWLPDLPGHGGSHDRARPLPDLEQLERRTVRWLAALDPVPFALGGHSLGALLIREAVAARRLDCRRLVLLAAPTPRDDSSHHGKRSASHPAGWRPRSGARRLRADLAELIEEEIGERPAPAFLAALGAASLRPPELYPALLAQLRRRLAAPVRRCDRPISSLMLYGACDSISPPETAGPLRDATAKAELTVLAAEGHFPWALDAAPAASAIEEFLARVEPEADL